MRRVIIPSIALPWDERLEYISLDSFTIKRYFGTNNFYSECNLKILLRNKA